MVGDANPFSDRVRHTWRGASRLAHHLGQRARYQCRTVRPRNISWGSIDKELKGAFLSTPNKEEDRYSVLFAYIITGMKHFGTSDFSRIYYPGASSNHGAVCDSLEGFSRALPMVGAWIASGRPRMIDLLDGQRVDLIGLVRSGLLAGTSPESKNYWGRIGDFDQRIVEAADIALSIWLLRDHLWNQLASSEREAITEWLSQINGRSIWDNNWHLFPVVVNEVLAALGQDSDPKLSLEHYGRVKSFYKGDGWFSDGPDGDYDYYNAWGMHYFLFWLNLINPELDRNFINNSLDAFVRRFIYFFSVEGPPIIGRSICYRMATPVPLLAAAMMGRGEMGGGTARRALNCVWEHFLERGAIGHGRISQGYWQDDLSLLDNYSGPGSSLCSTRSLAVAFFNPPNSALWTKPLSELPVELDDFIVDIPAIRWEIRGCKGTGEVQIIRRDGKGVLPENAKNTSITRRLMVSVAGLPYRLMDRHASYELSVYSSHRPYWVSPTG